MLVSFREPIGAVTTTEMKPLGWKTNSLIRTARAAALREKTTRKKRLTDRARTFRKSGLDVQKNMRRPAAGAFFYLTSPFIGQCYVPCSWQNNNSPATGRSFVQNRSLRLRSAPGIHRLESRLPKGRTRSRRQHERRLGYLSAVAGHFL